MRIGNGVSPTSGWPGNGETHRTQAQAGHLSPLGVVSVEGCHPSQAGFRSPSHLAPGTRGVRLACEIPNDQILPSDFLQWHHALNYGYLSLSQVEDDAFEAELALHGVVRTPGGPLSDPVYHQRILDSWDAHF